MATLLCILRHVIRKHHQPRSNICSLVLLLMMIMMMIPTIIINVGKIASVNGTTTGTWMKYATEIESAGADAIELNLYHYEVDPHRFAADIETELIERVSRLCEATSLPVACRPQFQRSWICPMKPRRH